MGTVVVTTITWQEVFHTLNRNEAEDYCRKSEIDYEWIDGNTLRTHQVRNVIARHPLTLEPVWFNHATFFHKSTLEEPVLELLNEFYSDDVLPFNTYYGDGSEIESATVETLKDAYENEKVIFDWEEGDVLVLDNLLCSHGREPYTGERQILTIMAESNCWKNLTVRAY